METKTELTPGQKAARTRKLNNNYTPIESGKIKCALLRGILEAQPALSDIEILCLISLILTIRPRVKRCSVFDRQDILQECSAIGFIPKWFDDRARDYFRRGKYWQSWQNPEELTQRIRTAIEGLAHRGFSFRTREQGGNVYTYEGKLFDMMSYSMDGVGYIDIGLTPAYVLLPCVYEYIDFPALITGYQKGGSEYLRLRLALGAWRPVLNRGHAVTLPIAGLLPEYGQKREGEKEGTARKRKSDTRKKLQRAADRITEEGGVDISITANSKGEANITITPAKKGGKDDGEGRNG